MIQPIWDDNCAMAGCHLNLVNPNLAAGSAYDSIVGVPADGQPALNRVEPGDADASYLINKIEGTHTDVGGAGGMMPLLGGPLGQSEITLIRLWIEDGASP